MGKFKDSNTQDGYLTGQVLVAMPTMRDSRFARTVIYVCAHNSDGAMGLVINRLVGSITFPDLLRQLGIDVQCMSEEIRVHSGGPVEASRGFVLHSGDYRHETTLQVAREMALTATMDILEDIAVGQGPRRSLLALGYACLGPGQLDSEIQANGWLNVAADEDLIFSEDLDKKWDRAIAKLGIDIALLSTEAGRA